MKRLVALPNLRQTILASVLLVALVAVGLRAHSFAAAGACTAPSTDYGTVTANVNITGTGTYRIWTRMAAPDSTNNTYMLEIDGNQCYTIGGSTVPVFTSTQDTNNNRFASFSTNWTAKTTTGTPIDVAFNTTGNHAFKLIGAAPGVVVDRVVLTQDLNCTPTGTGDNCANPPDTTDPVVNITAPADNASVSATPTITANATDDVAVNKVDFYVDGAKVGTDNTSGYSYTITSGAALSVGSHTIYAIATDSSGNTAQSTSITVTVSDTTPPTITQVTATNVTQTTATITWTTNEAADSQVKYGTTTTYSSTTTTDTTKVTSHSVNLTGLTAGTLYHFQVVSKDTAGNPGSSADASFTTQAVAGDTTAPTISVTAPAAGNVSGTVAFSATASDNVGVVGVTFKRGSTTIGSEDTSPPYSVNWNTTGVANGSYTLTATARDAAGNTKSATVNVTVNNATGVAADINQDGSVDYLDLSVLATNYDKSGAGITTPRADINQDGSVDYLDLSALASKYGT